ncbi:MAG: hypothetical protein ACI91R_002541 [Vicingaceae bacterium]|jgi:hypothetical protein
MANLNQDNAAYLSFMQDLNEILVNFNINKINYS